VRYGGALGALLLNGVIRENKDMQFGLTNAVLVELHGSSGMGLEEIIDFFQSRFDYIYYAGRACNDHWRESGRIFYGRHSKNYAEDPEESSQSGRRWMIDELPTWCALPKEALARGGSSQLKRLRESVRRLKPHRAENILFLSEPIENFKIEGLKTFP